MEGLNNDTPKPWPNMARVSDLARKSKRWYTVYLGEQQIAKFTAKGDAYAFCQAICHRYTADTILIIK